MMVLVVEDYFKVMTSEVDLQYQRSRSTFFECPISYPLYFPPKISLGWDPLGSIKICCSLTRFLFRVRSLLFI